MIPTNKRTTDLDGTRRVLFVIPRVGRVGAGAETLLESLARRLAHRDGWEVDVATTCCLDDRTWSNDLPSGRGVEQGLVVHRFPVEKPTWLASAVSRQVMRWPPIRGVFDRRGWRPPRARSAALRQFLRTTLASWDAVVAGPTEKGTTADAVEIAADRLLLLPCLHDEPDARLGATGRMLRTAARLAFNTEPERDLARRLHGESIDGAIVGIGIDPPATVVTEEALRAAHGIRGAYLCYVGRFARGKGVERLVATVEAHNRARPHAAVTLVLAGAGVPRAADTPSIRHLGYVDEATKQGLLAAALANVSFSPMESLSIVLLEAGAVGTPSIVHADAPVLAWQVNRSGGGLTVRSDNDFAAAIDLLRRPGERTRLGAAARRFVRAHYDWGSTLDRFIAALPARI